MMKEKWLVVSNCQTVGLGNCLSLLCPQVEVETCDIWKFRSEFEDWTARLSEYSQLIINPELKEMGLLNLASLSNVTYVPGFDFRGFHPDLAYVTRDGAVVKSPLDDYHSLIIAVGFRRGLSEAQTRRLFTARVYEKLGFFAIWEQEKRAMLESFSTYALDVRSDFIRWMRGGGFMHTKNHPKIEALYDIASKVAKKLQGGSVVESGIRPHDNLTVAPIFPVYPEIAERYGVDRGSYFFKTFGAYRVFDLDEFISRSYAIYEQYPIEELQVHSPHYDIGMNMTLESA